MHGRKLGGEFILFFFIVPNASAQPLYDEYLLASPASVSVSPIGNSKSRAAGFWSLDSVEFGLNLKLVELSTL